MNTIYFSLGSNQGDRFLNLQNAVLYIEQRIGTVDKVSSYYETEPWGFVDDIPFINQVIKVSSGFSAGKILERALLIEKVLGRQRIKTQQAYAGRTIDVDILFFNNEIINDTALTVPHKFLQQRKFVLEPLNEIAPQFLHPLLKKNVQELLFACNDTTSVKKLSSKDILTAVA